MHTKNVISRFNFIWIVGPLALLLFPFVQKLHSQEPTSALSITVDLTLSMLCALGFSSPLFFYFARVRKRYLTSHKSGTHVTQILLLPAYAEELAAEARRYLTVAWVGAGLGALAAVIGVVHILQP